jgi:hypothetical protein
MKPVYPGHHYKLTTKAGQEVEFQFYQDKHIHAEGKDGPLNQEVIRMLIDRVKELEREAPYVLNLQILYHLRMALVGHEARALERKVEKGVPIEYYQTGPDGHIFGGK